MESEVPVWIGGNQKWVTGIGKKTTCDDLIKALLKAEGKKLGDDGEIRNYTLVERWRKMERPLESKSKILKVWKKWGDEQPNVRFTLKKVHPLTPREVKSSRRKNSKSGGTTGSNSSWRSSDSIHPKKLGGGGDITEAMERLMKMIITQGETIQTQLQRLQDKDDQIDTIEQKVHHTRMVESGANYVLETYLGGDQARTLSGGGAGASVELRDMTPGDLQDCIDIYEMLVPVLQRLEDEEEKILRLNAEIHEERNNNELLLDSQEKVQNWLEDSNSSGDAGGLQEQISQIRETLEQVVKAIEVRDREINLCDQMIEETKRALVEKEISVRNLELEMDETDKETVRLHSEYQELLQLVYAAYETQQLTVIENKGSNNNENEVITTNNNMVRNIKTKDKMEIADNDSNSDTGLSSLHSSSDEGAYVLDTLV